MSSLIDMRVLDLLSARLCHELISPVTAVNNGVELLGEDDPDFVLEATALIAQSAKTAGQRLQFYRFAYGAQTEAGSGGPDPRGLVDGLLDGGKTTCDWQAGQDLGPAWRKLACNLVVMATEALPRGGAIVVTSGAGAAPSLAVAAQGEATNLTAERKQALLLQSGVEDLTPRTVHAYYTALLARQLAAPIAIDEPAAGRVVFCASA